MGLPQSPTSKPYPRSVQLKLYHAFIFSVPVLFTIILFLLFHLFYIKRRRGSALSPPPQVSTISNPATLLFPSPKLSKEELRERLPAIIFNRNNCEPRETQCCVCLLDFQMEEILHRVPSCQHIFHFDCIHDWLMTNSSCPLCRAPVLPLRKKSPANSNANPIANPQQEVLNSDFSTQNRTPVGALVHGIATEETRIDCCNLNSTETRIANEDLTSDSQFSCDMHQVHQRI